MPGWVWWVLAVWWLLAVVGGVLIGRVLAEADRRAGPPPSGGDTPPWLSPPG